MAVKAAQVVLELSTRTAQYMAGLKAAETRYSATMARLRGTTAATSSYLRTAFAGMFAGASLAGAQRLIDASIRTQNALRVAGLEGESLTSIYERLFQSAQKNAVPMEAMAQLYGRVALAQDQLGVSSEMIARLAETVGMALRVAGADVNSASGALLQLSQALGGGVVRGEEFNSLMEGAPTILQAAANGIKEAGGSVARLRKIMLDGELSSRALFDGIVAGAGSLETRVEKAKTTFSQRFQRIQNALEDAAGRFNTATSASDEFGGSLDDLATFIQNLDMTRLLGQIDAWIARLSAAEQGFTDFFNRVGEAAGLDVVGEAIGNQLGISSNRGLRRRMEGESGAVVSPALQDYINRRYGQNVTTPTTGRLPQTKRAIASDSGLVSIYDDRYKPLPGSSKSKGAKPRESEYQREVEQIRERTAAILAETSAMAGLDPLVDDYGLALEKAKASHDLLNAAQEAGLAVTPELRATIEQLAADYANASAAADRLAASQDKVREAAEEAATFSKDLMRGMVDGLIEGKDAADIFADALRNIGTKLLDLSFDSAFDPKTGFLGKLIGGFFGGGGFTPNSTAGLYHTGGVAGRPSQSRSVHPGLFAGAPRMHGGGIAGGLRSGEVPAILQRGEIVLPKGAGRGSGVAASTYAPVYNIDATNSAMSREEFIAILDQRDRRDAKALPGRLQQMQRRGQL